MGSQGDSEQGVRKLWYLIGEVARMTQVEPSVLRHWETEFRGLRPKRSRSGQRLYTHVDVKKILQIKRLLYDERFTIRGAVQQLRSAGDEPRSSNDPVIQCNEKMRAMLLDVRQELLDLLAWMDKEASR